MFVTHNIKKEKEQKKASHPWKSASWRSQLLVFHQINYGSFSFTLILAPNVHSQKLADNFM